MTTPTSTLEDATPTSSGVEVPDDAPSSAVETAVAQELEPVPVLRLALAVVFPLLAAATMAGGVFAGITPRVQAAVAALLGVFVATLARRARNPLVAHVAALGGVLAIGVLMVLSAGAGGLIDIGQNVRSAAASGDVLRPPVPFDPGWRAILGWIMGGLGFAAAWASIEVRRPAIGALIPLVIVGFAAISVPKNQQLASGIAALALFAIGLGMLSTVTTRGEAEGRPVEYELRRAIKGLPMIGGVLAVLYFLARIGFLFPPPVIDPLQEAQKPKPIPLSEATDRVLFTVKSSISGPWRLGHLDVYETKDSSWRLPPFAENRLKEVPSSGIVDPDLDPGFKATFEVRGLGGAVLPGLANTTAIVAQGPDLAYDPRTGTIRVAQGQILPGVSYTVTGGKLPSVEDLRKINQDPPKSVQRFMRIPDSPPAVQDLLREAPNTSSWDRMEFMRARLLSTVVATGAGQPVSVPPSKVDDMLAGSKEGSPFEIVAAQAMLARWAGVPSRIAYGFDGGEKVGEDTYEVRPRHGATFLEVYFQGYKWLPIIGNPQQAKSTLTESEQQESAGVLPSDDISVELFFPLVLPPESNTLSELRRVLVVFVAMALLMLALYVAFPAIRKSALRARRRRWAEERGPTARIALAYSEWRDYTTDLGYRFPTDTPLMFLDRVADDDEHVALAWLVTRCLWGDRQLDVTDEDAVHAEELAASLRKRTALAHPWTLRFIAVLSRLSLRYPFAPLLDDPERLEGRRRAQFAA